MAEISSETEKVTQSQKQAASAGTSQSVAATIFAFLHLHIPPREYSWFPFREMLNFFADEFKNVVKRVLYRLAKQFSVGTYKGTTECPVYYELSPGVAFQRKNIRKGGETFFVRRLRPVPGSASQNIVQGPNLHGCYMYIEEETPESSAFGTVRRQNLESYRRLYDIVDAAKLATTELHADMLGFFVQSELEKGRFQVQLDVQQKKRKLSTGTAAAVATSSMSSSTSSMSSTRSPSAVVASTATSFKPPDSDHDMLISYMNSDDLSRNRLQKRLVDLRQTFAAGCKELNMSSAAAHAILLAMEMGGAHRGHGEQVLHHASMELVPSYKAEMVVKNKVAEKKVEVARKRMGDKLSFFLFNLRLSKRYYSHAQRAFKAYFEAFLPLDSFPLVSYDDIRSYPPLFTWPPTMEAPHRLNHRCCFFKLKITF